MGCLQIATYCVTDIVNRMYTYICINVTYLKISEVHDARFIKGEDVEMCHSDLPLNSKANFAN
jgi:hypothetical protein